MPRNALKVCSAFDTSLLKNEAGAPENMVSQCFDSILTPLSTNRIVVSILIDKLRLDFLVARVNMKNKKC
ncbi:hypothetical protein TUM4637_40290 [Shewanella hafniensis]|nr:hypothetical protein TUM4637_40290 [Shewanella hafniensis]